MTTTMLSSRTPPSPLFNIAHRGVRSLAPENTLAAIKKAWHIGAHGVEVDVSVTADGELILFHDDLLTRTTDVHAVFPERSKDPVTSFTLKELRRLDAGLWFVRSDPLGEIANGNVSSAERLAMDGLQIPLLADVLDYVKNKGWYINLELKKLPPPQTGFPVVERVLELLDKIHFPSEDLAISSFVFDYLRQVQRSRPDIEVNALIGIPGSGVQDWGDFEFTIYNANSAYTDEKQIKEALKRGCRVNLFTVNDPQQMIRFRKAGVDKLITDYPQILKELILQEILK
ncbi:MAG: glycerophosphodiester phosphodiesterase [Desulfofustis sp.]|nr:glycerophosphodiester phosphodiesterase [Desulfofustis sp.]